MVGGALLSWYIFITVSSLVNISQSCLGCWGVRRVCWSNFTLCGTDSLGRGRRSSGRSLGVDYFPSNGLPRPSSIFLPCVRRGCSCRSHGTRSVNMSSLAYLWALLSLSSWVSVYGRMVRKGVLGLERAERYDGVHWDDCARYSMEWLQTVIPITSFTLHRPSFNKTTHLLEMLISCRDIFSRKSRIFPWLDHPHARQNHRGGELSTVKNLVDASIPAKLNVNSIENLAPRSFLFLSWSYIFYKSARYLDYARTLREWSRRFQHNFASHIAPALKSKYTSLSSDDLEIFRRKWICACSLMTYFLLTMIFMVVLLR